MRKIEIAIAPDGNVTLETKGFSGKACKAETAEFERSLGRVKKDTLTKEAFRNVQNTVSGKA